MYLHCFNEQRLSKKGKKTECNQQTINKYNMFI